MQGWVKTDVLLRLLTLRLKNWFTSSLKTLSNCKHWQSLFAEETKYYLKEESVVVLLKIIHLLIKFSIGVPL
jgi:hypothetical protein